MSTTELSSERFAARLDEAIVGCAFSGVVRIDQGGHVVLERAAGFADRRWSVLMKATTRLSTASATKGFTALAVMSLVESGELRLDTSARALLGTDLPLIDDDVTIEHLLGHRSGIGDYLDEDTLGDISDHAMPVPVHQLDSTEAYLTVLDGFPQVSAAGERFAYNNGAYVVLALLAERAARRSYHDLVDELVIRRAGLTDTGFIRSDALPTGVATGYLDQEGLRTNALHLPVLGAGDGGLFSTAADMSAFWSALFDGRIVSHELVELMTHACSDAPEHRRRYGLGFWSAETGATVFLEGYDAGVSFRSMHDPTTGLTRTTISNTSEGTWDLLRAVAQLHET
jgi:CubicO group peptidase (beta-lactamase class C family)